MMNKQCEPKGTQSMKILVDTNVILDVLCAKKDFVDDSSKVWKYCEKVTFLRFPFQISYIFFEKN